VCRGYVVNINRKIKTGRLFPKQLFWVQFPAVPPSFSQKNLIKSAKYNAGRQESTFGLTGPNVALFATGGGHMEGRFFSEFLPLSPFRFSAFYQPGPDHSCPEQSTNKIQPTATPASRETN
jgi:hypothetical protein